MLVGAGGLIQPVLPGRAQGFQVKGHVAVSDVLHLKAVHELFVSANLPDVGGAAIGMGLHQEAAGLLDGPEIALDGPGKHIGMGEEKVLAQAIGQELRAAVRILPTEEHLQADGLARGLGLFVAFQEALHPLRPGQVLGHGAVSVEKVVGDDDARIAPLVVGAGHLLARGMGAGAALGGVHMGFVQEFSLHLLFSFFPIAHAYPCKGA